MAVVVDVLAYATFMLDLTILAGAGLYVLQRLGVNVLEHGFFRRFDDVLHDYYLELSFLLALIATSGSLYLSNVLHWTPCRLCWLQRIFMYPLVLLTAAAIILEKDDARDYVLPLAIIGLPISFFHFMVQKFQFETGCSISSVSCSTQYTFHFGYITIPVMAGTAFLGIIILMWKFHEQKRS